MEDDTDIRDFSKRPVNDHRPSKPPRKTKVICQNLIPPPGCPDYVVMNHAVMGIPKPTLLEIRSFLPEKKKVTRGWPTCLKRSPPMATFQNNDIYARSTESSKNLHEEPQEMKIQEEQGSNKKNMCVFYKLNVNENGAVMSTPHEEEFDKRNYEYVKKWETAL